MLFWQATRLWKPKKIAFKIVPLRDLELLLKVVFKRAIIQSMLFVGASNKTLNIAINKIWQSAQCHLIKRVIMLSVVYAKCLKQAVYAECLNGKCRYAECCGAMHHWDTSNKCHEFKVIVEKN